MDLRSIAESKLAHELEQLYVTAFKSKLKVQPHIDPQDRVVFQWLSANFPQKQAQSIVQGYFKLADRYVVDKAYPVKLMKQSVNQILATIGTQQHSPSAGKGLTISCTLTCDKRGCHKPFIWIGTTEELGRPSAARFCGSCAKNPGTPDPRPIDMSIERAFAIPLEARDLIKRFKGEGCDTQAQLEDADEEA